MKYKWLLLLPLVVLCLSGYSSAQAWSSILNPSNAINWSSVGVGGIPARTTNCASLTSSATVAQINSALASCPSGQTVALAAGTYAITGTINVPANVTLRGAGANQTILNSTVKSGPVVSLAGAGPQYGQANAVAITGGASAGSTSIKVGSATGIAVGSYLIIDQLNNGTTVSANGSEGPCTWCDNGQGGTRAQGQIVAVTSVAGTTIGISPGLYVAYTLTPHATPFNAIQYAGVEDLQVYANNTHTGGNYSNFSMSACAYCWVKGVESNYTDGDHVMVYFGYRDEIRDSYFSNAYLHSPGTYDSDVDLAEKTSASLVENNIIERNHESVMLEWGVAGNVVAYNYTMGEFDSGATNVVIGGIDFHGAHPQFNLLEGNVLTEIYQDSIWGTSSQTTAYRNWVIGTNHICTPTSGRGTVSCTGANGHYGFQAARAMDISYLATVNNYVANVVGSAQMQSLVSCCGYNPATLTQTPSVEYPATRNYVQAYGWSFGYGEASDDGSGTGCDGGTAPCHLAGTSATDFFHGNYNNVDGLITWASGVTHTLPASFYLSSKPSWWGSMAYPATGSDVTGGTGPGGYSYGNPAQACYFNVMGGSDGGAGSPLTFNAATCYGAGGLSAPTNLVATPH